MDNFKTMDTLKVILFDLGISQDLLDENTLLRKDLQLDSTETVEIALALKRQLGINVKLETREDMTLAQLCDLVDAILGKTRISL